MRNRKFNWFGLTREMQSIVASEALATDITKDGTGYIVEAHFAHNKKDVVS